MDETSIRLWRADDVDAIRPHLTEFLRAQYAAGGDYRPTERNVEAFLQLGLLAAGAGDPCVVAYADGKLVGFCMWVGAASPAFDTRERSVFAFADYVCPEFQRQGWSVRLRAVAKLLGASAGYTRCDGFCLTKAALKAAEAAGAKIFGVVGGIPLTPEKE